MLDLTRQIYSLVPAKQSNKKISLKKFFLQKLSSALLIIQEA